jgi:hypothetical protein
MTRVRLLPSVALAAAIAAIAAIAACSDGKPIGAPSSDGQYDDGDDPGSGGTPVLGGSHDGGDGGHDSAADASDAPTG